MKLGVFERSGTSLHEQVRAIPSVASSYGGCKVKRPTNSFAPDPSRATGPGSARGHPPEVGWELRSCHINVRRDRAWPFFPAGRRGVGIDTRNRRYHHRISDPVAQGAAQPKRRQSYPMGIRTGILVRRARHYIFSCSCSIWLPRFPLG